MWERLADPRLAAALVLAGAAATIGGALIFQHGFGYLPCKLCLVQRDPYYLAMPLAAAVAVVPLRPSWARLGLAVIALVFVVGAGLGLYHSGVEWGWWAGPSDCGGAAPPAATEMGDFLKSLQATRVVSCTEAAWRFAGLSLAGWNVLISLALAALAGNAALRGR